MPFSTPSLTRQNAFHIDKRQIARSPLDPICEVCFNEIIHNEELVKPCHCHTLNRPAFFAHKECFIQWLASNGYPKRCSTCKSKYTIIQSRPISWKRILQMTFIFILLYYFFIHLKQCTTIQTLTKQQIQAMYGESALKDIPEQLILPRLSKSCLCTCYQSLSNHFISISHLLFITLTAILSSFILIHFI